jgi:hypothetical protein
MKQLNDYIHLYLGCEFLYRTKETKLHDWTEFTKMKLDADQLSVFYRLYENPLCEYKLVLRRLDDMTEEEMEEVWYMSEPKDVLVMNSISRCRKVSLTAERTRYLLSICFDLFGLIDSGLAIDRKTL